MSTQETIKIFVDSEKLVSLASEYASKIAADKGYPVPDKPCVSEGYPIEDIVFIFTR